MAVLEVVLNVVGDLAVTGDGANNSVWLKITVSSPLGSDDVEIIGPANIDMEMLFEVPYQYNTSGEFKILVEALAGQSASGPFSATQTVNFEQTVTLKSVSVKDPPGGQVTSDTGFEYPTASGSSGSPPNTSPTAEIADPAEGDSFLTTDIVAFNGTGTDDEDGNLVGSSLSWNSDLQGFLGSGTTLNSSLNHGNHVITLTATDDDGASDTDSVSVSVATPDGDDSNPEETVVAWEAKSQNTGGSWSNSGWANRSFRILLKGSAITTTGSTVQLTLRGRTSGSYTVQRVSLVQRDGTTLNGVDSTRAEVTFGGTWDAGVTVPAGGFLTSDPIAFELASGQDVFLTYWVPADEPTVYRNGGSGTSAWTISGNDQSKTIDWQGLSFSHTRSHIYILEHLDVIPSGPLPVISWSSDVQNAAGRWANSGWANRSFRILLKGSAITTTGSTVQLTLRGRTSGSYTVQRVSLVQRDGTTLNGVDSTRAEVTFGGTWDAGVTVPAGGFITSDPIAFDLASGQDVFLTYWVPADEPTVYRNGGSGTSAWTISGNDQSKTIDWQGLSFSETRSHVYMADQLEVVP